MKNSNTFSLSTLSNFGDLMLCCSKNLRFDTNLEAVPIFHLPNFNFHLSHVVLSPHPSFVSF